MVEHVDEMAIRDAHIEVLEQRIAELEAERRWIPVDERLPEPHTRVMVAVNDGKALGMRPHPEQASVNEYGVWFWGRSSSRIGELITHWMVMPKMPEVADAE